MKKIPVTLFVVSALFFILPEKTEAQSLKDILKSETAQKVIDAVKEATALNSKKLMKKQESEPAISHTLSTMIPPLPAK